MDELDLLIMSLGDQTVIEESQGTAAKIAQPPTEVAPRQESCKQRQLLQKSADDILMILNPGAPKDSKRNHQRRQQKLDHAALVTSGFILEASESHKCKLCNETIESGGIFFKEQPYHSHHYVCSESECQVNLKNLPTFQKHGNLYCEKHYHKNFSPNCAYCNNPIKDGKIVSALGKQFHPAHFFCSQCGKVFDAKVSYIEYDKKAYCQEDYLQLFAGRCSGCHKPLDGEYISAMDKDWHTNCFICSVT